MTDVSAQAFREAADDGMLKRHIRELILAAAEQREQLDELKQLFLDENLKVAALKAGIQGELSGGNSLPDFWTAERQLPYVAQALNKAKAQIATLTAERDQARHTVQLLCDLISQHPNPALAELLPDILDPRERTE